ncbi:hypothetical protein ACFSTC_08345 [Nonomuraea ferruginea]
MTVNGMTSVDVASVAAGGGRPGAGHTGRLAAVVLDRAGAGQGGAARRRGGDQARGARPRAAGDGRAW